MGLYIKNWSLADWKELLKWAKIGANNAMIGEFAEVEEIPPHGRLIDGDVAEVIHFTNEDADGKDFYDGILFAADFISQQPTIIEAEEGGDMKCVYANWHDGNPPCCTHECNGCLWSDDEKAEEG